MGVVHPGVHAVYITGGGEGVSDRASYSERKWIHEPEILNKKIPGIKISYPKKGKT